MDAHPPPSAGTGAVNLRGEVAIYLSRQPEAPTALVVERSAPRSFAKLRKRPAAASVSSTTRRTSACRIP